VNPIGKTGLGWSLHYRYWELEGIGWAPNIQGKGTFNNDWAKMKLIIRKIGPVEAGASVPNRLIGYVTHEGAFNTFSIHTSNEADVGTLSCKTPSVVVKMGEENRVGQFKGVGTSLAPVNFSIGLKQCPEGLSKASYLLEPNTNIVDNSRSVVALNAASTAKGVGLQILNRNGDPAPLNTMITFSGYDEAEAGGDLNIRFKAAYYQTSPVVEPGTANSSVTLVMDYN
jgi:type 1 fimbria pilin